MRSAFDLGFDNTVATSGEVQAASRVCQVILFAGRAERPKDVRNCQEMIQFTVNPCNNDMRYNDFRTVIMRSVGTEDLYCRITVNPVYQYRKDLASNFARLLMSEECEA